MALPELRSVRIHGYRRSFLVAGDGPPLVLVHGIGNDHTSWLPVLPALAAHYTVIVPDLLGHGESDKPRADYSAGGFANGLRDLLTVLRIKKVTIIGHSFGGGIAMQFGYQFPERTERLVLVSSGGLGKSVNPLLRLFSLPGSGPLLALGASPPVYHAAHRVIRKLHESGLPYTIDMEQATEAYGGLRDPEARFAFRHLLRAVIDVRGQVVTMIDRAYLAEDLPVMVIWGEKDSVIPVKHARYARDIIPGVQVRIFEDAGHFPHRDQPELFAEAVLNFLEVTPPAEYDAARWRKRLLVGPPPRRSAVHMGQSLPSTVPAAGMSPGGGLPSVSAPPLP
jgi:pimeloyl-ACP methyl ester carboxylesterase